MSLKSQSVLEKEIARNDEIAHLKANLHVKPSMQALFDLQFSKLKSEMGACKTIAELGCGTGEFIEHCYRELDVQKLVGLDASPNCISIARDKIPEDEVRINFFVGDAAQASCIISDKDFETVVMRGVIHHLEDPAAVFEESIKLLKSGGKLIIYEGNTSSLYRRCILKIADVFGMDHEASQFPHTPPHDIEKVLLSLGFDNIRISYVPGFIAPLAYTGFGGCRFWHSAMNLNRLLGKIAPRLFGWWYLMTADKL